MKKNLLTQEKKDEEKEYKPEIKFVEDGIDNFLAGLSPNVGENVSKGISFEVFKNATPNFILGSASKSYSLGSGNLDYSNVVYTDVHIFKSKAHSIYFLSNGDLKVIDLEDISFPDVLKRLNYSVFEMDYYTSPGNLNLDSNIIYLFFNLNSLNYCREYGNFFVYYIERDTPISNFSDYKFAAVEITNTQTNETVLFAPLGRIYEWEEIYVSSTQKYYYVFTTDGNYLRLDYIFNNLNINKKIKFYLFTQPPFSNFYDYQLLKNSINDLDYARGIKRVNSLGIYPINSTLFPVKVKYFENKKFFWELDDFRFKNIYANSINKNYYTIDGFYPLLSYYYPGVANIYTMNIITEPGRKIRAKEEIGYVAFIITFINDEGVEYIPYIFYHNERYFDDIPYIKGFPDSDSTSQRRFVRLNLVLPQTYLPLDVKKVRVYMARLGLNFGEAKEKVIEKIPLGHFVMYGEYDLETGKDFVPFKTLTTDVGSDWNYANYTGNFYTPYWAINTYNDFSRLFYNTQSYYYSDEWCFFRNILSIGVDYFPSGGNTLAENLNIPVEWTLETIDEIHKIDNLKFREFYYESYDAIKKAGRYCWVYNTHNQNFQERSRKYIKNKFIKLNISPIVDLTNSKLNIFYIDKNRDVIHFSNVGVTPQWDIFPEGNVITIQGETGKIQAIKAIGDEQMVVVYNNKSYLVDLVDLNIPITSKVVSKNRGVLDEIGIGTFKTKNMIYNTPYGVVIANKSGIYLTDFKSSESITEPIKSIYLQSANLNDFQIFYNINTDELFFISGNEIFVYNFKYKNWHSFTTSQSIETIKSYYYALNGEFFMYSANKIYYFSLSVNPGDNRYAQISTSYFSFGEPSLWKRLYKILVDAYSGVVSGNMQIQIYDEFGNLLHQFNFPLSSNQGPRIINLPRLFFKKLKINLSVPVNTNFVINKILITALLKSKRSG